MDSHSLPEVCTCECAGYCALLVAERYWYLHLEDYQSCTVISFVMLERGARVIMVLNLIEASRFIV